VDGSIIVAPRYGEDDPELLERASRPDDISLRNLFLSDEIERQEKHDPQSYTRQAATEIGWALHLHGAGARLAIELHLAALKDKARAKLDENDDDYAPPVPEQEALVRLQEIMRGPGDTPRERRIEDARYWMMRTRREREEWNDLQTAIRKCEEAIGKLSGVPEVDLAKALERIREASRSLPQTIAFANVAEHLWHASEELEMLAIKLQRFGTVRP
jgi:hypothetical protein